MTDFSQAVHWLWGKGEKLSAISMSIRAFSMFFIVLAQIRFSGARSFGHKSSFDSAVVIMLGAVAARGVVGASPDLLESLRVQTQRAYLSLREEAFIERNGNISFVRLDGDRRSDVP